MNNQHFILLNDPDWAGPTAFRLSGSDELLTSGQRLSEPLGPMVFELRVDPRAGDPLAYQPLDLQIPGSDQPLFSARMIGVLAQAGVVNIDYYPATVTYQPTGEQVDYQIANVIGRVPALDRSKSEVDADEEDGVIYGIHKLRLDHERCCGLDIFRLDEMSSFFIVSSRLASVLTASGLTGMRIIADHEWRRGMI